MKTASGNERKHYAFENAPRCGAKTKGNNGNPCRAPAVHNKARCRIHGGSKGSGAKKGNANALKHGCTTAVVKRFRKTIREIIKTPADQAGLNDVDVLELIDEMDAVLTTNKATSTA